MEVGHCRMTAVPDLYEKLLNATIDHLQALKEEGVDYIKVSAETLKGLQNAGKNPSPVPTKEQATVKEVPQKATVPKQDVTETRKTVHLEAAKPSENPQKETAQANDSSLSKAEKIALIKARTLDCLKCPNLVAARKNVVFGVGDIEADLMFVGEAPGAEEDHQGEPFVGAAGQLLTKIIQAMGLNRNTVYIANILKCRPDTPGQTSGNRKPTPAEMQTCISYLQEQIDVVKPKVLVALGATAVEGLLKRTEGITRLRGQFLSYRGIPAMPTYHPAYLLHNQAITEKRKVWEDMMQVMEKLGLPISEKQRGFFLRG